VTGLQKHAVRDIAHAFGRHFDREPIFSGQPTRTAWLSDAREFGRILGQPETSLETMISHVATFLDHNGTVLGKPTHFETRDGKF
jgi:hypothetical protein